MEFKLNDELKNITPFIVMEMLEKAKAMEQKGEHIIHFEVGEPDFDIPKVVQQAMAKALQDGQTHYTHSLGLIELREEIARFYKTEYDVTISPNQVMITSGTSASILLIIKTLCNSGDEVIISDPGYACYANFLRASQVKPIFINVFAENNFQFNIDEVKSKITPKTKAIFLNSPMNPTGVLVSDDVFTELSKLNIPIISDEIYHGLHHGEQLKSLLNFNPNGIVVNGFSKRWAMTGLRLGWIITPEPLIRPLQILQQNLFICAPTLSQYGGISALKESMPEVESMRITYAQRGSYMRQRLEEMGLKIAGDPKGAFYLFCDVRDLTNNSYQFCLDALTNAKIAITPGIDFGNNGEGFIRFSYATSIENIKEGMDRLERYLRRK